MTGRPGSCRVSSPAATQLVRAAVLLSGGSCGCGLAAARAGQRALPWVLPALSGPTPGADIQGMAGRSGNGRLAAHGGEP